MTTPEEETHAFKQALYAVRIHPWKRVQRRLSLDEMKERTYAHNKAVTELQLELVEAELRREGVL